MLKIQLVFSFILLTQPTISFAQYKAIVVENVWNNDLNNYNPKEYVDKLFDILKTKLRVKDFVAEPKSLTSARKDETWDKNVKERVKASKAAGENAYLIAIATELRLPAFNLGKFLFKNPPRSSKLTFTLHVYDTSGAEIIGDTVVNRGCVVKTIAEEKGSKYFYSDYNNFMSDLLCHLQVIRKIILEKPLSKNQRIYMETK